jgi:pimeloyl-ACP methyl ester carboxylesterase
MSGATLPSVSTGFVDVSDARIAYEITGEGHPLVLIHAGIADSRMWQPQLDAFSQRYQVIRYDVRGFGRSSPTKGVFSHRDDLFTLLDALGIERAHLLGLSMGGALAVDFTLDHPERVSALITAAARPSGQEPSPELIDAWTTVDEAIEAGDIDRANELELRMWVDGPYRNPTFVAPEIRALVAEMNRPLLAGPDEGEPEPLDPPALGRLHEIEAPTLVMFGDRDMPDVVAGSYLLASGIAGAERVSIPCTAHMFNLEQPDIFNEAVLDFLARVDLG